MAISDDDLNEDWLKTLEWDLPTDLEEFIALAGGTKAAVEQWISTHAAVLAMPHDLVQQVGAWLDSDTKGDYAGHEFHGNQWTGGLSGEARESAYGRASTALTGGTGPPGSRVRSAEEAKLGKLDAALQKRFGVGVADFQHAAEHGLPQGMRVELTKVELKNGDVQVSGVFRGGPRDAKVGTFDRYFEMSRTPPRLEMLKMELKKDVQGQGIARGHYEGMVGLAAKMGCQSVGLTANISVGGYAWGKFGFVPNDFRGVRWASAYDSSRGLPKMPQDSDNRAAVRDRWYSFADSNNAKDALLSASWYGTLNLTDQVAVDRFNTYTGGNLQAVGPGQLVGAGTKADTAVPTGEAEPVDEDGNDDWIWGEVGIGADDTKEYNPDQPRDDHGRWSSDGGGETAASTTGGIAAPTSADKLTGSGAPKKQAVIDAENRIRATCPNAIVDLSHGSLQFAGKTAATLADRVEKFAKEFPEAARSLQTIRMSSAKEYFGAKEARTTFGWTRGNPTDPSRPTEMHFNTLWFRSDKSASLDHAIEKTSQGDPPWHPTSTVAGTFDHELGHVLDFNSGKAMSSGFPMQYAGQVSGYAASEGDRREGFAEAFAVRQQEGIGGLLDRSVPIADHMDQAISDYKLAGASKVAGVDTETATDFGYFPVALVDQMFADGLLSEDDE